MSAHLTLADKSFGYDRPMSPSVIILTSKEFVVFIFKKKERSVESFVWTIISLLSNGVISLKQTARRVFGEETLQSADTEFISVTIDTFIDPLY